jgi:hypothetical protein
MQDRFGIMDELISEELELLFFIGGGGHVTYAMGAIVTITRRYRGRGFCYECAYGARTSNL